mgnify:CR=1 FL=1
MKVLVTGIGGFIGAHVARRFIEAGHEVIGVDDFSTGRRENVPRDASLIVGDLADTATIAELPQRCDLVLHLAGQSSGEISFDNPVQDLRRNTVSTLNLIHYGIERGISRFVYASSMSVYGSVPDAPVNEATTCAPLSCYGVSKLASERYLHVYSRQLPFTALRMFNVYGPGQDMRNLRQGMVSIYLAQALASGTVHIKGGLDRFRDFIYIDDVVEAWWQAAFRTEAAGKAINVGTGRRTTGRELLGAVRARLPGMTWHVDGSTPGDQTGIHADVTQMQRLLGMAAFTCLEDGLHRFIEWTRSASSGDTGAVC